MRWSSGPDSRVRTARRCLRRSGTAWSPSGPGCCTPGCSAGSRRSGPWFSSFSTNRSRRPRWKTVSGWSPRREGGPRSGPSPNRRSRQNRGPPGSGWSAPRPTSGPTQPWSCGFRRVSCPSRAPSRAWKTAPCFPFTPFPHFSSLGWPARTAGAAPCTCPRQRRPGNPCAATPPPPSDCCSARRSCRSRWKPTCISPRSSAGNAAAGTPGRARASIRGSHPTTAGGRTTRSGCRRQWNPSPGTGCVARLGSSGMSSAGRSGAGWR